VAAEKNSVKARDVRDSEKSIPAQLLKPSTGRLCSFLSCFLGAPSCCCFAFVGPAFLGGPLLSGSCPHHPVRPLFQISIFTFPFCKFHFSLAVHESRLTVRCHEFLQNFCTPMHRFAQLSHPICIDAAHKNFYFAFQIEPGSLRTLRINLEGAANLTVVAPRD
jgi:hypothetical protein